MDIRESFLSSTSGDGKSCRDVRRTVSGDELVGLLDSFLDSVKVVCVSLGGEEDDSLADVGIPFPLLAAKADGRSDGISLGRFNRTAGVRGFWWVGSCTDGAGLSLTSVVCLDVRGVDDCDRVRSFLLFISRLASHGCLSNSTKTYRDAMPSTKLMSMIWLLISCRNLAAVSFFHTQVTVSPALIFP